MEPSATKCACGEGCSDRFSVWQLLFQPSLPKLIRLQNIGVLGTGRRVMVWLSVPFSNFLLISIRSSFQVQISSGPGAQPVRVLPSTSMSTIWAVMASIGCPDGWIGGTKNCTISRGGLFNGTASTTYESRNNYSLENVASLKNYGLASEAIHMGLDLTTLGYKGSSSSNPQKQIIWDFGSYQYTLQGLVGLHQAPVNLSDTGGFGYPNPSFIQTLRNANSIPSVSYGYTAGAKYRTFFYSFS
jgi:hypothetical protein